MFSSYKSIEVKLVYEQLRYQAFDSAHVIIAFLSVFHRDFQTSYHSNDGDHGYDIFYLITDELLRCH